MAISGEIVKLLTVYGVIDVEHARGMFILKSGRGGPPVVLTPEKLVQLGCEMVLAGSSQLASRKAAR